MFSINLPSKTFLLGEYIVLDGGPCLILTTPPCFEMRMIENSSPKQNLGESGVGKQIFHPQSPARLWLQKNADFFKKYHLDFFDPHQGKGGFGSSGAEFVSVYATQHAIEKNIASIEKLLESYWSVVKSDEYILPSGADLVAQVCGEMVCSVDSSAASKEKITYWYRTKKKLDILDWPFQNLSYCLIRTGYKQATHQQLKKLPLSAMNEMIEVVQQGYAAFQSGDSLLFVNAIKEYANWMKKEHCVLPSTETLIEFFYQSNLICAAKGCGALGADVILILLNSEKMPAFLAWLRERQITGCQPSLA